MYKDKKMEKRPRPPEDCRSVIIIIIIIIIQHIQIRKYCDKCSIFVYITVIIAGFWNKLPVGKKIEFPSFKDIHL
jgi:hypothetical protein